ncbi:MAG: transporter, family, 3-phenylpropionic acid transporter [Deferribacteres bacterium]|nr:major facilitator superfamily 1 [Deferribacteraceae bacterium]MDK2792057.1 transporter, family, 3-phenylpropionic acid transporter [Deferribacteres bacterium]
MNHFKKAAFLSLFYFFHFGTLGIFIPFVALYLKTSGFSGSEIGIFITIVSVVKFLFTNKWTKIYNSISYKKLFLITAIIVSNSSVILLIFSNYLAVFLSFVIYSVARVGILPVIDHISNEFSRQSGIEYGKIRLFGSIGFIVFTTLTGLLVDYFDINVFIIMSVLTGLLSAISISFVHLFDIDDDKKNNLNKKLSFDFKLILFASLIYFIPLTFFHNFMNIKVQYLNSSQTTAGIIWSVGICAEILLMFFSRKLFEKIQPYNLLIISMLLGSIRSFVIGYTHSPYVLLVINLLHGFAFGTFHLSIIRYIKDSIPDFIRLKAQSYYATFIYGLGAILGSIISGYLYDIMGVENMFITGGFFALSSGLILLLYRNKIMVKYTA